ncbi:MAG: hypothetical protein HFACDABA_02653 [Anaerolineales bacterium]|nr:hypothetical protein [Anaerolineales bacterium]
MKKLTLLVLGIFVLAACASAPTVNLSGEWTLESYGDASSPTPALPDVDTSLTFADGQLNGNVGCNGFGGGYESKGNTLTFGPLFSTLMYCEETDGQEQGVLSVFVEGETLTVTLDGDRMTIASADGASVVVLVRK